MNIAIKQLLKTYFIPIDQYLTPPSSEKHLRADVEDILKYLLLAFAEVVPIPWKLQGQA